MERKRYTQADLEKRLEAMIAERGGRDAPLVSSTIHAEVRELQKRNKELAEQRAKKAPVEKKEEPKKEPPKKKPQTKKKPEPNEYRRTKEMAQAIALSTRRDKKIR